jgi:hypothetical protein
MRNYLESVEAAFHAYRKRARRSFGFWWDGKLESKTSAQKTQSVEFQRQVSKQMRELGRQAFIGPIIVELEFWASERNSAEVHSLAKHYLDLLHRPHPDSGVERKHLLFRDDSQIQYLTCIYNAAAEESGMHIRARRLSDFFSDIALLRELETGGLPRGFTIRNRTYRSSCRQQTNPSSLRDPIAANAIQHNSEGLYIAHSTWDFYPRRFFFVRPEQNRRRA